MLVLAAVRDPFVRRLEHAVRRPFRLTHASTWEAALQAILRLPVEIGLVDPALEGAPRTQEIERLRVLFPSVPLIVYTSLAPALATVLLTLGEAGVRNIVLATYDDHPERLNSVLAAEGARTVSRQLLHWIADIVAEWPPSLRWAVETIVREPASIQSVQDLADRADMDRRTCVRWFAKAQLPPPSVVLTVFRVIYAHRLLQDPGYTVEDVAQRLGYQQTRSFALNVKEVLGMSPGELRVSLRPAEAIALVRERYFTRHLVRPLAKVS
jgi:AraC-like DNA-binding protein